MHSQQPTGVETVDQEALRGQAPLTNIAELISRNVVAAPDRTAVVQGGADRRTLTWAELDSAVDKVAAGLAAHGLVAGHRVGLVGRNSIEFVVAYFAVLRAGFVAVPLDPSWGADTLREALSECGTRVVLAADPLHIDGSAALPLTPDSLAALGSEGVAPVMSPPDREALAALVHTAGTSGPAKIAMLSHRALLGYLESVQALNLADPDAVVAAALPLFGIFGLNGVLGTWAMAGATLAIADSSGEDLIEVIEAERVTDLPLTPVLLQRLLRDDRLDTRTGSLRTVICSGAPLPASLAAAFTRHTDLPVHRLYGLTEAAPGVATTVSGDIHGPGHVGRVLPGVTVRIGQGADRSEPGEIWIRADSLFSGYWPGGSGGPDADGWFATGDIGYLRDDNLFVVDRAQDLIMVDGFHVYPAEIEEVIANLAGVSAVAVIGRPGGSHGEQVVAVVAGCGLDRQAVLDHCTAQLAKFKRPTEVLLVDELPRAATGKINKGALRQHLDTGEPGGAAQSQPAAESEEGAP
ncbi:MAG TPA: class I adenylate-forming enzyme family protein [Propionibacteriaceae bacterium]|nr:class I adenylate-forming enzyme family protein [Propionibacteriaceae bacterium]